MGAFPVPAAGPDGNPSIPRRSFPAPGPVEPNMDLLSLAQQRFEQLAPWLALPMSLETSEAVEAWVRDQVCPVVEQLLVSPRFREWARWSAARLGRGSASPERRLVEGVDRALVEAARRVLEAARGLGLLPTPGGTPAAAPPIAPPAALSALEWLAQRPWFDLAYPGEYFTAEGGLHLTMKFPDRGSGPPGECDDVRAPLGDYVGRAMFARIGYFSRRVDEAFGLCLVHRSPDGVPSVAGHARFERMLAAKLELDGAIATLRRACHLGTEPRLREACTTLVQVYAAYGPEPDVALGWLGFPASWPSVCGAMIRGVVRPPGELIRVAADGRGGYRVVGREKARLCRPDVALGIAGSLVVVAGLYRRPVEADELIEWMRQERRLVLVDRRPRCAYWEGEPVGPNWDRAAVLWDLLWKLAEHARRQRPVDREELTRPGLKSSAVKNRRSRLSRSIPAGLDAVIEDVRPGGYRLALGRDEIGLLQLDHDEQLIEAGLEVRSALM
jgi:hypothetical protein